MLGEDYPRLLEDLMASLSETIELPPSQQNYFKERGSTAPYENNARRSVRTSVRTRGVLVPEQWLPVLPKLKVATIIYTKDFSKSGFGFIADQQFYPGEIVRVLLATFWMRVTIRRCRRIDDRCFEVGGRLASQHAPSSDAFSLLLAENS